MQTFLFLGLQMGVKLKCEKQCEAVLVESMETGDEN